MQKEEDTTEKSTEYGLSEKEMLIVQSVLQKEDAALPLPDKTIFLSMVVPTSKEKKSHLFLSPFKISRGAYALVLATLGIAFIIISPFRTKNTPETAFVDNIIGVEVAYATTESDSVYTYEDDTKDILAVSQNLNFEPIYENY